MSELRIVAKQQQGIIEFNFEEVKNNLIEAVKKYENLVFTDETMLEAKETRAYLNKAIKMFDDKRKEIKKEYCTPLLDFENKVKELTTIINNANSNIDKQIKTYEEKLKTEKMQEIEAFYSANKMYKIPLEKLFDNKWLNIGCKTKTWQAELSSKIEKIKTDLAVIDNFTDKDTTLIKTFYMTSLDMSFALRQYEDIENSRKELKQEIQESKAQVQEVQEEILIRAFKVKTTKTNIINLANYMKQNNISFEKIEI